MILSLSFLLLSGATAQEKKEVTLKGTITCGKCDLKVDGKSTKVTVNVQDNNGLYQVNPPS